MNTVFWITKAKNPSLFPMVMRTYHSRDDSPARQPKTGVLNYNGLNWRIMSDDDIYIEIYGELITELPDALQFATFEIMYMYDFLVEAACEAGNYYYGSARAQVSVQSTGLTPVYEIAIFGEDLQVMRELYHKLIAGELSPYKG